MLHPAYRAALAPFFELPDPPTPSDLQPVLGVLVTPTDRGPTADVAEGQVEGPAGPVPLRIYRPEGGRAPEVLVVWAHGGGFAGGDPSMPESDLACRELVARMDAVVVSVAYHLAGPVRFPVPCDDVVAAFTSATEQAEALKVDGCPVVLAGVSAGGNLAAGAALRLRDASGPRPDALLLVYPTLHRDRPGGGDDPGRDDVPPLLWFDATGVRAMYDTYLGPGVGAPSPYAVPGPAAVAGLPPTVVVVAELDGLRSSGEAFAAALAAAGVPVHLLLAAGAPHGFLTWADLPPAQEVLSDAVAALRRAVGTG